MFSSHPLKRSLRAKVTVAVVVPLALILGLFTILQYTNHQQVVLSDVSRLAAYSGQVVEANLRHSMLDSDFAEVQALLNAIGDSNKFRVIYVLDTSGTVIFAPNGQDVGVRLENSQPDCQPCHRLSASDRPDSVVAVSSDGQRVFRSMQPIENGPECARCHGTDDQLRGLLLTDIPMAPLEASLTANLRSNLLWSVGIILSTILLVNIVLNRLVLSRLERLIAAINEFGQGDLASAIPEDEPDEIGQMAGAFNRMAHRVEKRESENLALSEGLRRQSALRGELFKRLITAQEDERKRLARELHDELGQALTGLIFRAEAMGELFSIDPGSAHEKLVEIRSLAGETSQIMYELIMDLRPAALDDLGLAAAIRAYADRLLADTNTTFVLDTNGLQDRLPSTLETTLYRVFQEALSNVVRHAGAERVQIALRKCDSVFEGEIVDNGKGFALDSINMNGNSSRGLGLLGMQERVAQCGGYMDIVSRPGSGTRIMVRLPLKEVACG